MSWNALVVAQPCMYIELTGCPYPAASDQPSELGEAGSRLKWRHSTSAMVGRRDLITPNPKLKLLDQVREVLRLLLAAMPTSHNPLFHPPGLLPMCQLPALSGAPRGHPGILSQTEPKWHSGVMEETKACE